jgi:hypothetical protein
MYIKYSTLSFSLPEDYLIDTVLLCAEIAAPKLFAV